MVDVAVRPCSPDLKLIGVFAIVRRRILGGKRRVIGAELRVTVVDGADVLKKLENRRVPDGMIGRKRIDRVGGGVVAHISDHVVLVGVSELPVVKTTLVQRRQRGSRFNEDNVATLPHPSRLNVVETVEFAAQAVAHQPSFPRTAFQLLGVRLLCTNTRAPTTRRRPRCASLP